MTFKDYIKRLKPENKAGIYITVIFHLTVIVVLLAVQLTSMVRGENSFLLDFSRQEEIEQMAKEEEFKEDISRKIDEMLGNIPVNSQNQDIRNIAVDHSYGALKDDRGTDAEQLYKDAERLAKELKNAQTESDDDFAAEPVARKEEKKAENRAYSGPSVLSWHLDGRKASHLPIPAYRCYGGGMVTVIITVDNSGRVVDARIQEETSSDDRCLRDFAIRAARQSRFSIKQDAPARQRGDIIYQFLAQ